MLVSRGAGNLVPVLYLAGGALGSGVGNAWGSTASWNAGTSAGVAAAAVAMWFIGKRLNRPTSGFHPQTGQPYAIPGNRHTFFWVPVQFWGPIAGIFAVVTLVVTVVG